MPPCSNSPLKIYNNKNEKLSENNIESFISPKWGGIVIANPLEQLCLQFLETQNSIHTTINSHDVMQILLHLLRKVLELENPVIIFFEIKNVYIIDLLLWF